MSAEHEGPPTTTTQTTGGGVPDYLKASPPSPAEIARRRVLFDEIVEIRSTIAPISGLTAEDLLSEETQEEAGEVDG